MTSTLPESNPEMYTHGGPNGSVTKHLSEEVYQAMCRYMPTAKNDDGTYRITNPRGDDIVAKPDSSHPAADQYAS